MIKNVQISLGTMHFFAILFIKNDCKIKPVILHIINPMNSTKWVTNISWIFHFCSQFFERKSLKFLFTNARYLGGMWNYVQGKQKLILGGYMAFCLPAQNFRTRVRLMQLIRRGGTKKWENLGKIPKWGWENGNSKFQFWNFKKLRGVLIFQKCLNYELG